MRTKWMGHVFAGVGLVVFSILALGSATTPRPEPEFLPTATEIILAPRWSHYTFIHSLNYEVVGAVVVRDTSSETFLADLMDRAIAMGGHFIKNVRLSVVVEGTGADITRSVNIATATVIRYTDETIVARITDATRMPHIFNNDELIAGGEEEEFVYDRLLGLTRPALNNP